MPFLSLNIKCKKDDVYQPTWYTPEKTLLKQNGSDAGDTVPFISTLLGRTCVIPTSPSRLEHVVYWRQSKVTAPATKRTDKFRISLFLN